MPSKKYKISEIAQLAGVSPATVSRALNQHPYVTSAVRKRVYEAALQLGYPPRLNSGKKHLAIILNDQNGAALGAYGSNMLFQLTTQCDRQNISAEIFGSGNLELLEENFIRAAIFFQTGLTADILARHRHTQFIGINNPVPGCGLVTTDDAQLLKLAFDYLNERGHRRIALILPGSQRTGNCALRQHIFEELSRTMGEKEPSSLVEFTESGRALDKIAAMIRLQRPDALLVAGEDMCCQVSYTLALMGLRVPEDLSVISFENIFSSPYMIPPSTTLAQDFEQLAAQAVTLASRALDNELDVATCRVVIPGTLVERASVKKRFFSSR